MPFILTSFASLAKIEQWDKENLVRHLIESSPEFHLYHTKHRFTDRKK